MINRVQRTICILGEDGVGWSTDYDRSHLLAAMSDLGYATTGSVLNADIIYSVWWGALCKKRYRIYKRIFGRRRIIAVVTNDLSHQMDILLKYRNTIDRWVCANRTQAATLKRIGIKENRIYYNPFYVDEHVFAHVNTSRELIATKLGIDYNSIRNRLLIGSFQRDSLGADLTKPKWQKNPDLLLDIMAGLGGERYLLMLAGPRRHYIIRQCEKNNIPYVFIGDIRPIREGVDDFAVNNLPLEKVAMLYNLVDLYVVSSSSEGGPKSIIESALSKTPIISTDAGMSGDLLDKYCIYRDKDEAVRKIGELLENNKKRDLVIENNFNNVIAINNYDAFKSRIQKIVEF